MRISDWSSDVCSSDLPSALPSPPHAAIADRRDDRGLQRKSHARLCGSPGSAQQPWRSPETEQDRCAVLALSRPPPPARKLSLGRERSPARRSLFRAHRSACDRKSVVLCHSVTSRVEFLCRRLLTQKPTLIQQRSQ